MSVGHLSVLQRGVFIWVPCSGSPLYGTRGGGMAGLVFSIFPTMRNISPLLDEKSHISPRDTGLRHSQMAFWTISIWEEAK